MPDAQLFPDSIDLGERRPDGDGCVSPIGRRSTGRGRRPRPVRAKRPSAIAVLLLDLRRLLERQHADILDELRRLGRSQRDERESLPVLLRKVTEIQRALKLTEMHVPPQHSRRRPLGTT
jgi:hypothetical protein